MPVYHSGYPLFRFHVAVEAVQGQVFWHNVIVWESGGGVDVGLGADECIHPLECLFPAFGGGFVENFVYAFGVDRRQGEEDGDDAVVPAFLLDFL